MKGVSPSEMLQHFVLHVTTVRLPAQCAFTLSISDQEESDGGKAAGTGFQLR